MLRTATATAAFVALYATGAMAAYTIPAGNYYTTTLIQNITNDSTGLCASILKVGTILYGTSAVGGLGKTTQLVSAVPTAGSPPTIPAQVCNFTALPSSLNASGTTPVNGSATCTQSGVTYVLKNVSGQSNIVNVPATSNHAFYLNATSTVSVNGNTICTLQTSQLNEYAK